LYPNDGWICYTQINEISDNYYPIKLKPLSKLTVDLKYNNNKWYCDENVVNINVHNPDCIDLVNNNIYQLLTLCEPYYQMYLVKLCRSDKFKPNRFRVFNDVTILSKRPDSCTISRIIRKILNNVDEIYYNKTKIPIMNNIKELLSFMKLTSIDNINDLCKSTPNKNLKVLDVGCGSCSIGYSLDKFIQYYGVDPDPYVLNKKFKPRDNIYKLFGNFSHHELEINTAHNLSEFNTVILNNSLYYFNCDKLIKKLNYISYPKTKLYILNIFSDGITSFKYNNDFYAKRLQDTKWVFKYPWIGDKEFEQTITSSDEIKTCAQKFGWTLLEENIIDCPENLKEFESFVKLHKILIFEKI